METLQHILSEAIEELEINQIENARVDAWLLFEYVFGVRRVEFFTNPDKLVSQEQSQRYRELVNQRIHHIPLQHLTGRQEFMGFSFQVNEHVLIPRQETELLVEKALNIIKAQGFTRVLDMCTGSGCIIISLAKHVRFTRAMGVDISPKALEISKQNARDNQCEEIVFIESNLFEKITEQFDVIISNPPYIPTEEIQTLQEEVGLHEPNLALDGHEDGLFFYREITKQSKNFLTKGGYLLYEIGYNQAEEVREILKAEGFAAVEVFQDYAGHDRIVIGKLGG